MNTVAICYFKTCVGFWFRNQTNTSRSSIFDAVCALCLLRLFDKLLLRISIRNAPLLFC